MTTWIHRFDQPAPTRAGRIRVAVKDAIDVAGVITTAGCVAVRDRAVPAPADAACLAGFRAAGADLVGKTTLTELCVSPVGLNSEFGTPINPVVPHRIPGGSSSGSAVAVAGGEADIGLGTDTGGSVRIPAACCAIVGLKTTWGRIPATGVWPLARSLDTVGPLARTVGGLAAGMRLLAPGWTPVRQPARHVGRLRITGVDPVVEDLIDAALDAAGLTVRTVRLPGWDETNDAFAAIILGELWQAHHALLGVDGVGSAVADDLRAGRAVSKERMGLAMATRTRWQAEVAAALAGVDVLALPTLVASPPPLSDFAGFPLTHLTRPFNLAGVPALAMPVPSPGHPVPASLQLVGPMNGEELLCATALAIESALSGRPDPQAGGEG
jgi:amidase